MRVVRKPGLSSDPEILRIFGYFALVAGAGCLVGFLANLHARFRWGAMNLSFLGYVAAYALVVGWGSIRLRRWGVVLLAVPLFVAGVVFGALAVWKQPILSTFLLAIGWAALLLWPMVLTTRAWRDLN